MRGAFVTPADEMVDGIRLSFYERFHISIVQVSNPTADLQA
jgi:hypothetical protein